MARISVIGAPMDAMTMTETVNIISSRIKHRVFTQHVVVNVSKIMNMRKDRELARAVVDSDIINIDGMGVVWGARFLGFDVEERVAGIDLFYHLNQMAAGEKFPVFYLGAEEPVVQQTANEMKRLYPELVVAGYHHGYFWGNEEDVVMKIKKSGAKLLFVAITSPQKEKFINTWKNSLGVDFVMGVGGTFDVVSGKVKRAPKIMQRYGLEWCFRFFQEPRRMWKRYLITNLLFLIALVCEKIKTN